MTRKETNDGSLRIRMYACACRGSIHGLGISGGGDKVLGDCVRAGAVTDDHIDGATGHPRASPSVVVLPLL